MKMRIAMKNNVNHENLSLLFNVALAGQLRHSLMEAGLEQDEAWPLVQRAVFDVCLLFDNGTIEANGRVFQPRVSFVSDDGNALPGSAEFAHLHEYGAVELSDLEPQKGLSISF